MIQCDPLRPTVNVRFGSETEMRQLKADRYSYDVEAHCDDQCCSSEGCACRFIERHRPTPEAAITDLCEVERASEFLFRLAVEFT